MNIYNKFQFLCKKTRTWSKYVRTKQQQKNPDEHLQQISILMW